VVLGVVSEYGITLRAVRFEVVLGVRALMEGRSLVLGEDDVRGDLLSYEVEVGPSLTGCW
jgi:hypothetical protein